MVDIKSAQKAYLELMKELIIKNPSIANQIIAEELNELGINQKKEVKELQKVLKKFSRLNN